MKVIKPLQLSLQIKPFTWQKKNQLAVTVLLGFPFDSSKEVLLEQELWSQLPDLLGDYTFLDAGMPKPYGEVLVYGNYYAPGGQAIAADRVQLVMGSVDKSLAVIGSRYWRAVLAPTEPEAFTQMSITYNNAFGGKDYKKNPVGKGMDEQDVFGELRLPMPNIEFPDHLVTSTSQRPEPAGFSPIDMMWEPRSLKMGTYDEQWKQECFPGYPVDLDWSHFNVAPTDQWIENFWSGDETFKILNMHTEKSETSGKLPSFRTRCFMQKQAEKHSQFSEIDMRAETAFLFPNEEIGVMLFRGTVEVIEDDATDIDNFLVAYEDLSQQPRSEKYYKDALENRLDESKTFRYMMYTKDIIPLSERCGFARMLDEVVVSSESELSKNLEARGEAEKQKALEMIEEQKQKFIETMQKQNIDPTPYLEKFDIQKNQEIDDPQIKAIMETVEKIMPGITKGDATAIKPEEVDFSKFDDFNKQMDELAAAKVEQAKQQLRDVIEKVKGTEAEEQVRQKVEEAIKQMDELPLLPRVSDDEAIKTLKVQLTQIEEEKDKLRQQGVSEEDISRLKLDVDIDDLSEKLKNGMAELKDLYRIGAHYIEGRPPHSVPMDIVQYRFKKALEKGESFTGRDLSGVDFSGLDLSGLDLSDCYLEYTNFTNAKLKGTNFKRAILSHADMSNADLSDAIVNECNMGDCKLNGTIFSNADFSEGVLDKSDFTNAKLSHCDLSNMNYLDATLINIFMEDCNLKGSSFLEINLSGSQFVDCDLQECNFIKSRLEGCNFSNSNLSVSNFIECNLDHSFFTRAYMGNVRFLAKCSLKQCDFTAAILDRASLRDADAESSNFENTTFNMADFGNANLQKTKFYGSVGKRAMLMKADLAYSDFSSVNLMEGSLMKARLTGADLSYSNLYSVEFMGATVGDTDFTGANLDLTELEIWSPSR
ncbi:MAG: DUF2169 domain-containing protein [Gammaproteobacteria bacterium]|jgi:uncharacterized protein YjbI with pentapeptide repeats|nr:DUF2169 domain-containing protein [Gammaproteobacteria bacterium]MBT4450382.1 DUF2169 domain-containing protein [Gammaproteobacteria bacterium]MBT6456149.1 DUF2169 domain-containing protein [Gammaproteobacteria bacterium]MBT6553368.1 DUF2169 domain-containing protein [Gammaproteobacteria bacterium]MBT6703492.1 DUF2169 domain-containing protein [Gammaproteobacteria bacterium]